MSPQSSWAILGSDETTEGGPMLNREEWIMIKEMSDKGCYQKNIAAELGVSPKTVSRALKRQGAPARRQLGI